MKTYTKILRERLELLAEMDTKTMDPDTLCKITQMMVSIAVHLASMEYTS